MNPIRIGYGYDVHRLAQGETLWLGGVLIQHDKGTVAHSDGDVLIHALCDAMLGAVNMRDIGYHFPDTSNDYKAIDSKILLELVQKLVAEKGYVLGNADITVAAQKPKLKDHIPTMAAKLREVMSIADEDAISIKATTTEQLGFEGREEGISAHAVVLLMKK
ncbi:2-C-methyl-D-erythritol 2,4-cyclodiphosphate synthase [Sunxiuqinia elliptica]|uniref:2-C-methyl-D-erythritol 2,4-cyclodiphosphate synthase n=1 Tax=Sunxiuqinia elliptica TaxID=655355 RepID=A0A4R6H6I4_9BACT|nr:2-C-methyl-D-erythritol 2,4-cyclodiphosphate synthase [Sunxiuqinia elliptica]TDO03161.1 2-C-methyl-D-erythritol 2,4-cyclodiphosphate synthase [Sunxiuqinia elliptica]TDO59358.1 2-C-methyl-D-erythritol 2,4-cyclodiphosphate synthase [Sunxiuqinia elliptica]